MDTAEKFEQQYQALSDDYEVPEMISPKTKLIFILESPHVAEVQNGVLVAGASGATMSKKLFGPDYAKPLGLLLKKHQQEEMERPSLDVIGLLNVCNIPMQERPYSAKDLESNRELLDCLGTIRTSAKKTPFKEESLVAAEELLLTKFKNRLKKLRDREVTLVPCGRFAQKYFQLANVSSDKWTVLMDVPHPSYNSWSRDRYQQSINKVIEVFNRHKI
ncbi:uracil-DNA glycosylase family protein [Guptibacillus hwajinpoensis]|uniref:uracil-DNA glycosylase family protein n=1 Tax=Guptibacillus hwajinpoensis TaxID=208199 RepID=UPI001CFC924A|nr:uracil-DNA glycosylase family protein [Pseudalkalibacillus hwajinpoensis]